MYIHMYHENLRVWAITLRSIPFLDHSLTAPSSPSKKYTFMNNSTHILYYNLYTYIHNKSIVYCKPFLVLHYTHVSSVIIASIFLMYTSICTVYAWIALLYSVIHVIKEVPSVNHFTPNTAPLCASMDFSTRPDLETSSILPDNHVYAQKISFLVKWLLKNCLFMYKYYIPFVQASANSSDNELCFLETVPVVGNQSISVQ